MPNSRRGFLKQVAVLFPAVIAIDAVSTQAEGAYKPANVVGGKPPKKKKKGSGSTVKSPSSLKQDRDIMHADCSHFCDVFASRGTVAELYSFEPSIAGMQQAVVRPGFHSGQPVGVLLNDVVNMDLTRVCRFRQGEVQVGNKVYLCQDGDLIVGAFDKPVSIGERMFYDEKGHMTTIDTGRPIGVAVSSSDDDGFAKIRIQLYVNKSAELPSPN
jgi:hypothetical protein